MPVQVRLGQRMEIRRTARGSLLLSFEDPEPATESSGSGSSSAAGGSKQHSTGSKRARRE